MGWMVWVAVTPLRLLDTAGTRPLARADRVRASAAASASASRTAARRRDRATKHRTASSNKAIKVAFIKSFLKSVRLQPAALAHAAAGQAAEFLPASRCAEAPLVP